MVHPNDSWWWRELNSVCFGTEQGRGTENFKMVKRFGQNWRREYKKKLVKFLKNLKKKMMIIFWESQMNILNIRSTRGASTISFKYKKMMMMKKEISF